MSLHQIDQQFSSITAPLPVDRISLPTDRL